MKKKTKYEEIKNVQNVLIYVCLCVNLVHELLYRVAHNLDSVLVYAFPFFSLVSIVQIAVLCVSVCLCLCVCIYKNFFFYRIVHNMG